MKLKFSPLALAVFFLFAPPVSTAAQDLEVIVTATRSTQELPGDASITLTREDLEERPQDTLLEILASLPGLIRGGSQGDELVVSGFGSNAHGRLLVLLDGAVMNRSDMSPLAWAAIPISQIESITLRYGASSALYGDKAVAGVLDIRTGSPKRTGFQVRGMYGSFQQNLQEVSAYYNGDLLRLRADFLRDASEGHRERLGRENLQGSLMGFYEGEEWQLRLSGIVGRSTQELPGSQTWEELIGGDTGAQNPADQTLAWNTHGSLQWMTQGELWEIQAQAAYKGMSLEAETPSFGSFTKTQAHTLNLPVSGLWGFKLGSQTQLNLAAGGDLKIDGLKSTRYTDAAFTDSTSSTDILGWEPALYLRPALQAESWEFYGALRFQAFDRRSQSTEAELKNQSATWFSFPWNAGVSWKLHKLLAVNLDAGSLFRLPFLDEQINYSGFGASSFNIDLKPEEGVSARLSLVAQPLEGFQVTGHFLAQWIEGEIAYVFDPLTFEGANENQDSIRRLSATASAQYKKDWMEFHADVTYVNALFTAGAQQSKAVPLVAPWNGGVGFLFQLPLGFAVGSSGSWQTEAFQDGDLTNTLDPLPSRFLMDARLSWKNEALEVFTSAHNLLDTRYAPYAVYDSWYSAPGREFRLGLVWSGK